MPHVVGKKLKLEYGKFTNLYAGIQLFVGSADVASETIPLLDPDINEFGRKHNFVPLHFRTVRL